jgi:phosphopantothenoylcysteine synthetase/decarboxylase
MKLLITAGNTQARIDAVRCLTNIFTGRTGAAIAREAIARGHTVTLLTSHPETAPEVPSLRYTTFEDLRDRMAEHVPHAEAMIHCAAVSDYLSAGVYAPQQTDAFDAQTLRWQSTQMVDRAAGKVKSDEPELWLRLVRAPKLVDLIRSTWGFRGLLVKFKLEVGRSDDELLAVAERSRQQSQADLMVANTLEGASQWAFLGPLAAGYERVTRADLARRLLKEIESRLSREN